MRRRRIREIPEMPESLKTKITVRRDRTIFNPREHIRMAFYLGLLGHTDKEIAKVFGVPLSTLSSWKSKFPEFKDSLKRGKTMADAEVAYSMYSAAKGYEHEDEVILTNRIKKRDEKGKVVEEYTEPLRVKTIKRHAPNVKAGLSWLAKRQPEKWGNRLEVSGKITMAHQLDLTNLSTEELQILQKLSLNGHNNVEDVDYEEAI